MTGLFNAIGHETETDSADASARLHDSLAQIHTLLAGLERGDAAQAQLSRDGAVVLLDQVADSFDAIAAESSEYTLFAQIDERRTLGFEMGQLVEALVRFGYALPLDNNDLPRIASAEVQQLALVLRNARFEARHADWYSIRDVLSRVNRLNDLGVIVSRISALHGGDPQLRY